MRGTTAYGRPHLILVGAALALGFWLLEAAVHAFVFREAPFTAELLPTDPNELWMRSLVSFLFLSFGVYAHWTTLRIWTLERERAIIARRLQDALSRVLSGFVPICSTCKHIRDTDDNWTTPERYLAARSDVSFSHGICPHCESQYFLED